MSVTRGTLAEALNMIDLQLLNADEVSLPRDAAELVARALHADSELIAAAVNAPPDLLDTLEKAEAHRDERARLAAQIERVRGMHYPADNDPTRTPRCEECQGRAGTHPCGCWAPEDRQPVCEHCNGPDRGQAVPWPCPTIQALDGGGTDE